MNHTKPRLWRTLALCGTLTTLLIHSAHAVIAIDLDGTSEHERWAELTSTNFPTYDGGGFPGYGPWPGPIAPTEAGSAGNVGFNKTAGAGYAASASIYTFAPGSFVVGNSLPLSDLETVVFQIDMGSGTGGLFFTGTPVLNYNGGSQALVADFTAIQDGDSTFSFGGPAEPTTIHGYQWDLSSLGAISSYDITWTTQEHATIYALQLDSSDTFIQAIPEPSTFALGGIALGAWLLRRRRAAC